MRILLAFLFLFILSSKILGNTIRSEDERRLGLTYQKLNLPYKGYLSDDLILPFFRYKKDYWDVEKLTARAIFFNYDQFQTGFELGFEPVGYAGVKEGVLLELEKTYYSFPLGLYHLQRLGYLDVMVHFLVSLWGGDMGTIQRLTLKKDFLLFKDIVFIPFFRVDYFSQSYVNYYYGVKNETPSLPYYQPGSALNYILGGQFVYKLFKKVFINSSLDYTKLHGAITQSPIVTRSQVMNWSLSLSIEL